MITLRKERGRLMAKTFYRYASSTNPIIDRHLIYHALDWWSWYWVLVEAVAVFIPTGIALLYIGHQPLALGTLGTCVLAMISTQFFRSHSVVIAQKEVDEILDDPTRKAAVQQVFNAL